MTKLAVRTRRPVSRGSRRRLGLKLVRAFDEAHGELLSTLFYLLGNHEDAQDACQEAFLKCWRTRAKLINVRNLRAWIFRVGLNAAKDLQRNAWRRRARPLLSLEPIPPLPEIAPTDMLIHQEALDQVRSALRNLRPEEKEVFLLRQNGALTYEEIAALRRKPVGTVKTQMRSALQKIREAIQEMTPPSAEA